MEALGHGHGLNVVTQRRLAGFADAWDSLVDASPLPSPFLRSWWLEATAGSWPDFLLVMDGQTLVGGLALQRERRWPVPWYRFMGAGPLCPDHLDLLATPGREAEVVAALGDWLRRRGSRVLDLEGVTSGGSILAALPTPVRSEVVDVAPWAPLPPRFDDWLAERPRGFRTTVRKASRRLGEQGAVWRVVPADSLDASLATLRQLHGAQWGRRSHFLAGFDEFIAASRAGVAREELLFHELSVAGSAVACVTSFEVAGRVSLYQSGRATEHRWRSATTALLVIVIEDACRRGFAEVDLLRGGEPYKRNFADDLREILRVRAANGRAGRLALTGLTGVERARRLVGHLLRRARTAQPFRLPLPSLTRRRRP